LLCYYGLLASALRLRWQDWIAYGFLAALFVEIVQGLVLPGRYASCADVVANATALCPALYSRGL